MTTENTTTALTVVQRAVVALGYNEETRKKLTELAAGSTHIVAITNDDGYKQVHAARMALKNTRVEIEKRGKTAREDATAFSKAVIAEEAKLIALISGEEKRLADLQKAHDDKIEAEKLARERAELQRVSGIKARISEISGAIAVVAKLTDVERIGKHISDIEQLSIDESFAEFADSASAARDETLTHLRQMYSAAVTRKAEDERLAAERAKLAQERAEQEKRDAEAKRIRDEATAAEQARLRAEREKFEAEQAEAREIQRKEAARIAAEQAAAQKKIDDEFAELQRQQREAREAEEARERARLEAHVRMEREAAERARALRKALTKAETIAGPSCLTKAADDEFVFVLRAKDPCAPAAIRAWADAAQGVHEQEKVQRALDEALEFEHWRRDRFPSKEAA